MGIAFFPPLLMAEMYVIWKKRQVFTPIAERFLREMERMLSAAVPS